MRKHTVLFPLCVLFPIIFITVQSDNSIASFADLIARNSENIRSFFSEVRTISFIITTTTSSSDWDSLTLQVLELFQLNYTYNIFKEPVALAGDFADLEKEGFIICSTVKENDHFSSTSTKALWRRNGYYLVLLVDARDEEEIVSWLRHMWTTIGSVTVMTVFRDHLWTFQPFKKVNGSYGRIEKFNKDNPIYKRQLIMRNLHGYPLRLELFESGYYRPIRNSRTIQQTFVGPDKETIDVLERKMNFTGIYKTTSSSISLIWKQNFSCVAKTGLDRSLWLQIAKWNIHRMPGQDHLQAK